MIRDELYQEAVVDSIDSVLDQLASHDRKLRGIYVNTLVILTSVCGMLAYLAF